MPWIASNPMSPLFYSTCQASWDGWTAWSYNHFSATKPSLHVIRLDGVIQNLALHQVSNQICQPCRSDWQQKHPQWSFGTQTVELTARWLTGDQPTVHLVTTGYGQNPPSKDPALATPHPWIGWSPAPHSTSSFRPGSYSRIAQSGTVLSPGKLWHWAIHENLLLEQGRFYLWPATERVSHVNHPHPQLQMLGTPFAYFISLRCENAGNGSLKNKGCAWLRIW